MDTLELQVKSVDEALAAASSQWGVDSSKLTAEVLEETPGLFGKAKLKVRVKMKRGAAPKSAVVEEAPKAAAKAEPKEKPAARGRKPKAAAEPEPEVEEEAPVEEAKPAARRGRPAKADAKPAAKPAAKAAPAARSSENGDDREEIDVVATDDDAEKIVELVHETLDLAGLDANVKVLGLSGRYVNLELDGKDVAHLVGKQGEALNHLQYLLNLMILRQLGSGVRATLDGNNYRQRREEKLTALAEHVALQVVERQQEAVFDSLPAFERRVVHKALQEFEGVTTYSEGEEPNRHVVIAPSG